MNSEEKTLEILAQMQATQSQMQADIADLKETQSTMQATLIRVAVTQENAVIPQIKLLAEGRETFLNTLAPKTRTEALEDDVALLKTAIKDMAQQIEKLEKAQ